MTEIEGIEDLREMDLYEAIWEAVFALAEYPAGYRAMREKGMLLPMAIRCLLEERYIELAAEFDVDKRPKRLDSFLRNCLHKRLPTGTFPKDWEEYDRLYP